MTKNNEEGRKKKEEKNSMHTIHHPSRESLASVSTSLNDPSCPQSIHMRIFMSPPPFATHSAFHIRIRLLDLLGLHRIPCILHLLIAL